MSKQNLLHVNIEDPDDNFWTLNPQFKHTEPFKNLYKQDKDKAKVASSKIMFAIAMIYDPASKYRNLPLTDRIELLEEDYLLGKIKLHEDLINQYVKLTQSPSQRNLIENFNLLDRRTAFLKDLDYTLEKAKEVDAMFANTEKIYKALSIAKAEVAKEEGSTASTKGGQELSLGDQNEI